MFRWPVIDTRQRPGVPSYAGRPAVESSQGCICGLPTTLSPVLLAGLTSRHRKSPPGRRRAVTSSNAFCLHTQGFYLTGNIQGWKKITRKFSHADAVQAVFEGPLSVSFVKQRLFTFPGQSCVSSFSIYSFRPDDTFVPSILFIFIYKS